MRKFQDALFSPKCNTLAFYFNYALFITISSLINTIKTQKLLRGIRRYLIQLQDFIWQMLKCELFYLSGSCRNCGKCCHKIMLYYNENEIKSLSDYNKIIKTEPSYERFKPVLASGQPVISFQKNKSILQETQSLLQQNQSILHFNCRYLSKDNLCLDYENRPDFCRRYPVSSFIKYDTVRKGCGFTVKPKNVRKKLYNSVLKDRINNVEIKNNR
ncbi:YkgJ family cysteine cluster protein [Thermoproteota archaeon]